MFHRGDSTNPCDAKPTPPLHPQRLRRCLSLLANSLVCPYNLLIYDLAIPANTPIADTQKRPFTSVTFTSTQSQITYTGKSTDTLLSH